MDAPLVIFSGELDDWAAPAQCLERLEHNRGAPGFSADIRVFPSALHAFDVNRPAREYFGHFLAYNEEAAREATDMVRDYFDHHLRGGK